MSKSIIYLGGAISGLTFKQYKSWRDKLANNISMATNNRWYCFDPCDHLNEFGEVITPEESLNYDLDHLRHCRLMIASFEYTQKSTGTLIELGVAYENKIPIIGYNPENLELHPWIEAICTHICYTENGLYQFLCDHYLNEV